MINFVRIVEIVEVHELKQDQISSVPLKLSPNLGLQDIIMFRQWILVQKNYVGNWEVEFKVWRNQTNHLMRQSLELRDALSRRRILEWTLGGFGDLYMYGTLKTSYSLCALDVEPPLENSQIDMNRFRSRSTNKSRFVPFQSFSKKNLSFLQESRPRYGP